MNIKKRSHAKPNQYQKKLYKARRILRRPGFDLLVAKAQSPLEGDLMVITPARIGNAVQRNRIRRRIKALFSELGLLKNGYDWMVIIKKEGINLTYATLKDIINREHTSEII